MAKKKAKSKSVTMQEFDFQVDFYGNYSCSVQAESRNEALVKMKDQFFKDCGAAQSDSGDWKDVITSITMGDEEIDIDEFWKAV